MALRLSIEYPALSTIYKSILIAPLYSASMLLGRPSARERRFIVVPLVALVFSFILYCREYLLSTSSSRSTKYVSVVVSSSGAGSVDPQPVCVPRTPKKPAVLLPHTYRDDGILEVNPNGGHPIFEMIELANARWKSKLSRASKTFDEAVREYVKRYKRRPPKGFDKWCVLINSRSQTAD